MTANGRPTSLTLDVCGVVYLPSTPRACEPIVRTVMYPLVHTGPGRAAHPNEIARLPGPGDESGATPTL